MADSPKNKRKKENSSNDGLADKLLRWCEEVGLTLSKKVTVRQDGCCHRFGMIAIDKLEEGECIFKIPRSVLLEPNTSSISKIVKQLKVPVNTERHHWLPLLVTLLYEYTNPVSKWRPYLDLVPARDVLNQPIFWNKLEREYLSLIEMKEHVDNDIKCIEEQYHDSVIPFIKKHATYFDPKVHTLELYTHLAGFVMAYSFTDYGPDELSAVPAMVPMADILNHVSDNNAHLEFGEDCLTMVTTQVVEKGGEVFNTYGELDNCNLLRSYGFIEDTNPHDMVEIPMNVFQEVLKIPDEKWQTILSDFKEQNENTDDDGVVLSIHGCLYPEERLHKLLQLLHTDVTVTKFNATSSSQSDDVEVDFNENNSLENTKDSSLRDTVQDKQKICEKQGKLVSFVDLERDPASSNKQQLIEEKWESNWESDTEDDLESTDNSCEENSDDDRDTSDDDKDTDYEWDSDSHSSEDTAYSIVTYDDLHGLPLKWRQTLSSAAKICGRNITDCSMEFSSKSNEGINTRREAMVKNILHGQLSILKRVEQLHQLEI